jgi:GTP-binding protein Era
MKSGFVSLVGRPNVGKSTLLNSIVGHKVAITSNKPQTTRNIIEGIYNDSEAQIIFVDTPGIHKPTHKLGKVLNRQAYYSIDDVDIILFLVDGSESLGPGDKYVLERLKTVNKPVILVINKVDKISKEKILLKIDEYKDLYDFKEIIPLSALKKDNIETVVKVLKKYLKDNIKYYDEDTYTNSSEQFMTAEIIREKVFRTTEEEVPHSVTCVVEKMEFSKNSVNVIASIIVDRDSLKRIIIGKQGAKIKEIGISAREDIEALLGKKVYLDLYVRCIKKWRDREKYLQEFGYYDFEK